MNIDYARINALIDEIGLDTFTEIFDRYCNDMRQAFLDLAKALEASEPAMVRIVLDGICWRAENFGLADLVNVSNKLKRTIDAQGCGDDLCIAEIMRVYSKAARKIDRAFVKRERQLNAAA